MKKIFKFGFIAGAAAGLGVVVGICAKKILKKATKFVDNLSDDECDYSCDSCECECHCEEQESSDEPSEKKTVEEYATLPEFYNTLSVSELRTEAKSLGIKGIWSMNKSKLIAAICDALTTGEVEVTDTTTEEQW